MKKKILLVVGAGASVEFGMPSVGDVGNIISSDAQMWYPLAARRHTNLYRYIEGLIRRHWKKHVPDYLRREPHFEDVLYSIFALASAYPAGAYTSALGGLIKPKKLPDFMFGGRELKTVDQFQLHHLGSSSVDALLSEFRARCWTTERDKASEFTRLQSFIAALQGEFEIAIVTLNYDNIVYRAMGDIETGFDPITGRFHEERILERDHWPCMLHLHGSVHFNMPTPSTHDMHEIFWQPDLTATFGQNSSGRSTHANPEGADFPTSAIVAGYGKTTQILRRPFRTYYSELDRLVSGCDALLFAGYGFGDPHLNIAFERFRDARQRPVAIIGYAAPGSVTLGGADPSNKLAEIIVHTFHTDLNSMRWLGHSVPGTVDDLLAAREFETSADAKTPMSVWYNGMLQACDNPDKVIARLR